jgi:hypothetical protein
MTRVAGTDDDGPYARACVLLYLLFSWAVRCMMVIRSTRGIGFAWKQVIGAVVSEAPSELLNEFHMAHREELLDYCVWRQHNLTLLHLHRRPAETIIS